jgi:hypothetical protein
MGNANKKANPGSSPAASASAFDEANHDNVGNIKGGPPRSTTTAAAASNNTSPPTSSSTNQRFPDDDSNNHHHNHSYSHSLGGGDDNNKTSNNNRSNPYHDIDHHPRQSSPTRSTTKSRTRSDSSHSSSRSRSRSNSSSSSDSSQGSGGLSPVRANTNTATTTAAATTVTKPNIGSSTRTRTRTRSSYAQVPVDVDFFVVCSSLDTVTFADDEGKPPIRIASLDPSCDAYRKGARVGDLLVGFQGASTRLANLADARGLLLLLLQEGRRTEAVVALERVVAAAAMNPYDGGSTSGSGGGGSDIVSGDARYRMLVDAALNPLHVYFPSGQPHGIQFEGGDTFDAQQQGFTSVLISDFEEDSPAPDKGLRIGDVLLGVNRRGVAGCSLNDVVTRIYQSSDRESLHLTFDRVTHVLRGQQQRHHQQSSPRRTSGSGSGGGGGGVGSGNHHGGRGNNGGGSAYDLARQALVDSDSTGVLSTEVEARTAATYALKIIEDDNLDDLILVGGREVYPNAVHYTPVRVASVAFGSSLRSRGFREGDVVISVDGVAVQNRSMACVASCLLAASCTVPWYCFVGYGCCWTLCCTGFYCRPPVWLYSKLC